MDDDEQFYFNIDTRQVERGRISDWRHLMGPYATEEEASRALEIAAQRTRDADLEDAREQDD